MWAVSDQVVLEIVGGKMDCCCGADAGRTAGRAWAHLVLMLLIFDGGAFAQMAAELSANKRNCGSRGKDWAHVPVLASVSMCIHPHNYEVWDLSCHPCAMKGMLSCTARAVPSSASWEKDDSMRAEVLWSSPSSPLLSAYYGCQHRRCRHLSSSSSSSSSTASSSPARSL